MVQQDSRKRIPPTELGTMTLQRDVLVQALRDIAAAAERALRKGAGRRLADR